MEITCKTHNVRARRLQRGHVAFEERHLHSQKSPLPPIPPCLDYSDRLRSQGSKDSLFLSSSLISFPPLLSHVLTLESSSPPLYVSVSSVILVHSPALSPFFLLSSPRPSPHYCPLCCSSGQRSWQQHSVMWTPRPPAESSFLRKHGLTSCHFFLSS